MPKPNDRMDDARRQGQFEGRIEAKVDNLILSVDAIAKTNAGLDTRLRKIEDGGSGMDERLKESDRIHEDLYKQISTLTDNVTGLVKYQSVQRGVIIALGVLSTIITPVITALILQQINNK